MKSRKEMKTKILLIIILGTLNLYSQTGLTIRKQIVNEKDGQPIEYANVFVKKYSTGTFSNEKGFFEIKLPSSAVNDTITISCLGYDVLELCIKNLTTNKILMKQNINMLNEVKIVSNYYPRKILKKVYKHRKTNYPYKSAYSSKAYYRKYYQKDEETVQMLEMLVTLKNKGLGYESYANCEIKIDSIYKFYRIDKKNYLGNFSFESLFDQIKIDKPKKGKYLVDSVFFVNNDKYISIAYYPKNKDSIIYESYVVSYLDMNNETFQVDSSVEKKYVKPDKSYQYINLKHYVVNLSDYAIVEYFEKYTLLGKPIRLEVKINHNYLKKYSFYFKLKKNNQKYYPQKIQLTTDRVFLDKNKNINFSQNAYEEYFLKTINPKYKGKIDYIDYYPFERFMIKNIDKFYFDSECDFFNDKVQERFENKKNTFN